MFAKRSSVEYIPEELGGHGPAVGVEGSGRAVRLGVCQFEKERNQQLASNNLLLAVSAGGTLSASWHSSSMQD